MQREQTLIALLVATLVLLGISGSAPYELSTWLMEVAPILIVVPILLLTYRRFPLTTFLYLLIACHAVILMVGGAYTYARVPLGFWLQHLFDLSRNPYDRIGHFMQGFVPALAAREILLRGRYVSSRSMTTFLCICIAMAISASYELIEWGAAEALGQAADDFLGTQGDPWDTQWDMFMCLIGSLTAMFTLARTGRSRRWRRQTCSGSRAETIWSRATQGIARSRVEKRNATCDHSLPKGPAAKPLQALFLRIV